MRRIVVPILATMPLALLTASTLGGLAVSFSGSTPSRPAMPSPEVVQKARQHHSSAIQTERQMEFYRGATWYGDPTGVPLTSPGRLTELDALWKRFDRQWVLAVSLPASQVESAYQERQSLEGYLKANPVFLEELTEVKTAIEQRVVLLKKKEQEEDEHRTRQDEARVALRDAEQDFTSGNYEQALNRLRAVNTTRINQEFNEKRTLLQRRADFRKRFADGERLTEPVMRRDHLLKLEKDYTRPPGDEERQLHQRLLRNLKDAEAEVRLATLDRAQPTNVDAYARLLQEVVEAQPSETIVVKVRTHLRDWLARQIKPRDTVDYQGIQVATHTDGPVYRGFFERVGTSYRFWVSRASYERGAVSDRRFGSNDLVAPPVDCCELQCLTQFSERREELFRGLDLQERWSQFVELTEQLDATLLQDRKKSGLQASGKLDFEQERRVARAVLERWDLFKGYLDPRR